MLTERKQISLELTRYYKELKRKLTGKLIGDW